MSRTGQDNQQCLDLFRRSAVLCRIFYDVIYTLFSDSNWE